MGVHGCVDRARYGLVVGVELLVSREVETEGELAAAVRAGEGPGHRAEYQTVVAPELSAGRGRPEQAEAVACGGALYRHGRLHLAQLRRGEQLAAEQGAVEVVEVGHR